MAVRMLVAILMQSSGAQVEVRTLPKRGREKGKEKKKVRVNACE